MQSVQVHRLPVVGVMGSGELEYNELSEALGQTLARRGVHILTGGGAGVMRSVSRAFASVPERPGLVLGIIRSDTDGLPGTPNEFVELPILTHLPFSGEQGTHALSRNHINILSSQLVIALPGSAGTKSELQLCRQYQRPVLAYLENEKQRLLADIAWTTSLTDVHRFLDEQLTKFS